MSEVRAVEKGREKVTPRPWAQTQFPQTQPTANFALIFEVKNKTKKNKNQEVALLHEPWLGTDPGSPK